MAFLPPVSCAPASFDVRSGWASATVPVTRRINATSIGPTGQGFQGSQYRRKSVGARPLPGSQSSSHGYVPQRPQLPSLLGNLREGRSFESFLAAKQSGPDSKATVPSFPQHESLTQEFSGPCHFVRPRKSQLSAGSSLSFAQSMAQPFAVPAVWQSQEAMRQASSVLTDAACMETNLGGRVELPGAGRRRLTFDEAGSADATARLSNLNRRTSEVKIWQEALSRWPAESAQEVQSGCGHENNNAGAYISSASQGIAALAMVLVDRCGSLERAFGIFDFNHKGKVTRTKWDTSLSLLRLNIPQLCGVPSRSIFKMMDSLDGPGKGEVKLQTWIRFFAQQLQGTEVESLLAEDRGSQAARHLAEHRSRSNHFKNTTGSDGYPKRSDSYTNSNRQLIDSSNTTLSTEAPSTSAPAQPDFQVVILPSGEQLTSPRGCLEMVSEEVRAADVGADCKEEKEELGLGVVPGDALAEDLLMELTHSVDLTKATMPGSEGSVGDVARSGDSPAPSPIQDICEQPFEHHQMDLDAGQLQAAGHWSDIAVLEEDVPHQGSNFEHLAQDIVNPDDDAQADGTSDDSSGSDGTESNGNESDQSENTESDIDDSNESDSDIDIDGEGDGDAAVSSTVGNTKAERAGIKAVSLLATPEQDAALEQELAEELHKFELRGIEALAYVLTAKLGSLKRAFKWFDSNRKGKFAQVVWNTGMALLHIDTEKLTGWKSSQIFSMIDRDPQDGLIGRKEWKVFFAAVEEGTLQDKLHDAVGDRGAAGQKRGGAAGRAATARAKARRTSREALKEKCGDVMDADAPARPRGSRPRGSRKKGNHKDSVVTDHESGEDHPNRQQDEEDFRAGVRRELLTLAPGEGLTYTGKRFKESRQQFCCGECDPDGVAEVVESDADGVAEVVEIDADGVAEVVESGNDSTELKQAAEVHQASVEVDGGSERKESMPDLGSEMEALGGASCISPDEIIDDDSSKVVQERADPGKRLPAWRRSAIVQEVAKELGFWSLPSAGLLSRNASAEHPGGISLESAGGLDVALAADLPGNCLMRATTQARISATPVEPNGILVCNLKLFAEATREQLGSIGPGDSLDFPTSLSDLPRLLVHVLAADLGLTTLSEGSGAQRRVVAYNLSAFAEELRRMLASLQPGESKSLPSSLSAAQRRLVHTMAVEMGIWVDVCGTSLKVFNLRDFAAQVRLELKQLESGSVHDFPVKLSEQERQIVHSIACELGLIAQTQGGRTSRRVSVANLRDFLAIARAQMESLLEPEDKHVFGPPLTQLQRQALIELASELGLHVGQTPGVPEICVARSPEGAVLDTTVCGGAAALSPAHAAAAAAAAAAATAAAEAMGTAGTEGNSSRGKQSLTAKGNKMHRKGDSTTGGDDGQRNEKDENGEDLGADEKDREQDEDDSEEEATEEEDEELDSLIEEERSHGSLLSKVFDAYATGQQGGQRVFLRFSNLKEFAEDMKGVVPRSHSVFHKFVGILEFFFDDTLQLQADMGVRARSGLTLKWFQVFIQKAMNRLGLQIVSVLHALIDQEL